MRFCIIFIFILSLFGCEKAADDTIVVGTISGPETELVEVAKEEAAKNGLKVKIVEFSDYNLPNEALADKSLDANIYQHQPYLDQVIQARGYPFEILGKTFIYPMGVYSKQFHRLKDIPQQAIIAIPNDPSNEERALKLLEKHHLIKLKQGKLLGISDILENPKHLQFKEMDAAQLPRILPDVAAAVINTTYAIPAGLNPSKDAIVLENTDSPYTNLIVIRKDNLKKEQLHIFLKSFQSKAVKEKAKSLFGNGAIAAW